MLTACGILIVFASCNPRNPPVGAGAAAGKARNGVVEIEPGEAPANAAAGQTIYVPAYSSIYTANRPSEFPLAVTLSVRNTDASQPIVLASVRYFDHDGRLVRDFLKKPLRVAPLASKDFFVKESDTSGGLSASFLVEWVAEREVTAPVVESVMVSTASTQGVSFVCAGRVLKDRRPARAGE
jgi:hypothetical protein